MRITWRHFTANRALFAIVTVATNDVWRAVFICAANSHTVQRNIACSAEGLSDQGVAPRSDRGLH